MTWDFSINLPPLPPPELPDPRVEQARQAPGTQGLSDNVLRMVSNMEDIANAQAFMADFQLGQGREDRAVAAFGQAIVALSHIADPRERFHAQTRVFNRVDRDAQQYGARRLADAVRQARVARMSQQ
ncbi:MAG: hypothetical protein RMA76_35070 [Deltaproteobacteria bacterium]|jgi:hypothetical protein